MIFVLMFGMTSSAQTPEQTSEELYMPLEFRRAYEKGFLDRSGKVLEGYWQNRSKYIIGKESLEPIA